MSNSSKNPKLWGISPDGFIPALAITDFLATEQKILIIGDFTKRDFNLLTALDKTVYVLDIVPLEGIEHFYQQSITEPTPFENDFFDAVIMAEVIEHLFEDFTALNEINRILKPNGKLIVTVPYLSNKQDEPEYHVRVHSYKTINRLLQATEFSIQSHFYRGIVSRWSQKQGLKQLIFGLSKLLRLYAGEKKGLSLFQKLCFNTEKFLGSKKIFIPLQKQCISFGGIMMAQKDSKKDFLQIQHDSFKPTSL